jgi:hypothetical protein
MGDAVASAERRTDVIDAVYETHDTTVSHEAIVAPMVRNQAGQRVEHQWRMQARQPDHPAARLRGVELHMTLAGPGQAYSPAGHGENKRIMDTGDNLEHGKKFLLSKVGM